MLRFASKGYKPPLIHESTLSFTRLDRVKICVEIPDHNVNKSICTPILVERRSYEILTAIPDYFNVFWVDFNQDVGTTVLDVLKFIKLNLDSSLTFRHSCDQGLCGVCAVNVNGVNTLACIAPATPGTEMVICPQTGPPSMCDLITDSTYIYLRNKAAEPWLKRKGNLPEDGKEFLQSIDERKELDAAGECNACMCCNSVCPSLWWREKFIYGPAMLMQAYRWIHDSRDQDREGRLKELNNAKQTEKCDLIGACSTACPIGLDPKPKIIELKEDVKDYIETLKDWK